MVLELLIYAKSAIKKSEASIVVMWLSKEASDWSKFFYCRFGIFEQLILRPFYPWSFLDFGII